MASCAVKSGASQYHAGFSDFLVDILRVWGGMAAKKMQPIRTPSLCLILLAFRAAGEIFGVALVMIHSE